jgi:DNA-binding NarL/FixJ family response regulator
MLTRNQSNQSRRNRIFLIDDHPIVRQGLTMLIDREADLEVCGDAQGASTALSALSASGCEPDLIVLDISLNGPDGLDLLKTIRLKDAHVPVLVLSMHDEATYAERALRAGANGYIMKQEAAEKVLIAIRRILSGEVYLSERLTNKMLQQIVRGSDPSKNSPISKLSDRELEIYRLIGSGHGTRQIADELHISVKTVESYQAHIKIKLSLRSARELVQHAIEWTVAEKSGTA